MSPSFYSYQAGKVGQCNEFVGDCMHLMNLTAKTKTSCPKQANHREVKPLFTKEKNPSGMEPRATCKLGRHHWHSIIPAPRMFAPCVFNLYSV